MSSTSSESGREAGREKDLALEDREDGKTRSLGPGSCEESREVDKENQTGEKTQVGFRNDLTLINSLQLP